MLEQSIESAIAERAYGRWCVVFKVSETTVQSVVIGPPPDSAKLTLMRTKKLPLWRAMLLSRPRCGCLNPPVLVPWSSQVEDLYPEITWGVVAAISALADHVPANILWCRDCVEVQLTQEN